MSETEQTWDRLPLWFTEKPITVAIGNANEHKSYSDMYWNDRATSINYHVLSFVNCAAG